MNADLVECVAHAMGVDWGNAHARLAHSGALMALSGNAVTFELVFERLAGVTHAQAHSRARRMRMRLTAMQKRVRKRIAEHPLRPVLVYTEPMHALALIKRHGTVALPFATLLQARFLCLCTPPSRPFCVISLE